MFKKIHIRIISLLIAVFLLVINVSGVFAAAPLALHIVVDTKFDLPIQPAEFFASGLAVSSGLVCAHGLVYEVGGSGYGKPEHSGVLILKVDKHFVCDNDSNSFDVKMIVYLDTTTGMTSARWRIVGGTGDYVKLKGTGSLVGTPGGSNDVIDVYDGKVL